MNVYSVWLHSNGEGRTNIFAWRLQDPQQRLVVLYCGAEAAGTSEGTIGELTDGAPSDNEQENDILSKYDVDDSAAQESARQIVSAGSAQIDRDARTILKNGGM